MRRHDWEVLAQSLKGTFFLLFLVTCASMMPVDELPAASWQTAFGLGFVSAVFDNIPLTALALSQNGYDWGFLAFGVGYGGSMLWFGSSAGVALSNMYPEAKSVVLWLRHGWHVAAAYLAGFLCLLYFSGWHPEPLKPAGAEPVAKPHEHRLQGNTAEGRAVLPGGRAVACACAGVPNRLGPVVNQELPNV